MRFFTLIIQFSIN